MATLIPRGNTGERTWLWLEIINIKQGKKSRRDGKYLSSLISFIFILMSSLKAAKNHLPISHFEEVINDEEFLLLYDINKSSNPDLSYDLYEFFNFDVLEEDDYLSEFCNFRKQDIPFLAEVIQIPGEITFYQRSVCSVLEKDRQTKMKSSTKATLLLVKLFQ